MQINLLMNLGSNLINDSVSSIVYTCCLASQQLMRHDLFNKQEGCHWLKATRYGDLVPVLPLGSYFNWPSICTFILGLLPLALLQLLLSCFFDQCCLQRWWVTILFMCNRRAVKFVTHYVHSYLQFGVWSNQHWQLWKFEHSKQHTTTAANMAFDKNSNVQICTGRHLTFQFWWYSNAPIAFLVVTGKMLQHIPPLFHHSFDRQMLTILKWHCWTCYYTVQEKMTRHHYLRELLKGEITITPLFKNFFNPVQWLSIHKFHFY